MPVINYITSVILWLLLQQKQDIYLILGENLTNNMIGTAATITENAVLKNIWIKVGYFLAIF